MYMQNIVVLSLNLGELLSRFSYERPGYEATFTATKSGTQCRTKSLYTYW